MKRKVFPTILAGVLVISVLSCKKDKQPDPVAPQTSQPASPIPTPANANGGLVAVKTVTTVNMPVIGETTVIAGSAIGVFFNGVDKTSYIDAGSVSVNGENLVKQSNNSYVFTPTQSDPDGLDFSSGVSWNVSGSSNVPAFNATLNEFPANPALAGATNINTANAYTVSLKSGIVNADSIIFALYGPSGQLARTVGGSQVSASFTATEMQKLGKGSGYVQVAPYNSQNVTAGGKQYYLVNESVITKNVTFE